MGEGKEGAGQEQRPAKGSAEATLSPGLGCQGTEGKGRFPLWQRGMGLESSRAWEVPKAGSPTHALWGPFAEWSVLHHQPHPQGKVMRPWLYFSFNPTVKLVLES